MPSEENDTDEYHYMTWMMAQQKLLKKLKGRRLAKEEVTLSRHNKCYVCYQFKLTYVFYCISFYLVHYVPTQLVKLTELYSQVKEKFRQLHFYRGIENIILFQKQPTPRIDFHDNYYLPMHDFYTGAITCLEFSSDGK